MGSQRTKTIFKIVVGRGTRWFRANISDKFWKSRTNFGSWSALGTEIIVDLILGSERTNSALGGGVIVSLRLILETKSITCTLHLPPWIFKKMYDHHYSFVLIFYWLIWKSSMRAFINCITFGKILKFQKVITDKLKINKSQKSWQPDIFAHVLLLVIEWN